MSVAQAVERPQPLNSSASVRGMGEEEKRRFVHRLFTNIAPRYDWFNRLASLGLDQRWRQEVVQRGGIEGGLRVLDVCAGTGDLACLCARRQGRTGLVIGVDFNAAMLARASVKQCSHGLHVDWLQGDAQALPFADDSFDRVVIGFSTRNLSDLTAGLREMVRVLRPGGKLLILETGRPSNALMRAGYLLFLFTVARAIGFVLTGRLWPFTYLARSVQGFLTPQQFIERLQTVGTGAVYVPLSNGLASLYIAVKT